jgi:hypothetical protein
MFKISKQRVLRGRWDDAAGAATTSPTAALAAGELQGDDLLSKWSPTTI